MGGRWAGWARGREGGGGEGRERGRGGQWQEKDEKSMDKQVRGHLQKGSQGGEN